MEYKVSVIIPVYNGSKYITKTIKYLLAQNYDNFEIILVENNSKDNSWDVCRELQKTDKRIRAFSVATKGTTLARKYGIIQAEGDFILFHDQDDKIPDPFAFKKMVDAILQDDSDICQFGYIKTIGDIIKKRVTINSSEPVLMFKRDEIMNSQIKGILGFGWDSGIILNTSVWNKIYKAEILKEAVININETLYFCEDEYLNIFAFFNEHTKKISVRDECYYHWKAGIGFSSSKNAQMTFLKDYQYIKDVSIPLIKEYSTSDVLQKAYWDSLTVYKWTIYSFLYDHVPKDEILCRIAEIEEYQYIQEAKKELAKSADSKSFNDIVFLTSNYTSDEYYDYCLKSLPAQKLKSIIVARVKSNIVKTMSFFR